MRTRDLQKVERKNLKYRENNRILQDVVQNLENRNISTIAGSGSNQNDELFYEQVLRETNDDDIENMAKAARSATNPVSHGCSAITT